mmetsp:Transcript_78770/g.225674  ORF Transcript_78770/g.225674 Transcript_78770/m.225674 type:complete len:94 (+) Transcript_78770:308-589(+)
MSRPRTLAESLALSVSQQLLDSARGSFYSAHWSIIKALGEALNTNGHAISFVPTCVFKSFSKSHAATSRSQHFHGSACWPLYSLRFGCRSISG